MHTPCCFLRGAVVLVLMCGGAAAAGLPRSANFDGPPTEAEGGWWKDRLDQWAARDQADPKKPSLLDSDLMFLAEVYGRDSALSYYRGCLERISARGDSASLPALEALLNREVWAQDSRLSFTPSDADRMILALRARASEIWYEIKWRSCSNDEKNQSALYGLSGNPPVHLAPEVSSRKTKERAKETRPKIYALLLGREQRPVAATWYVWRISATAHLLNDPRFSPSAEEIKEVLDQGGDFGRGVMLDYLIKEKRDSAVLPALRRWLSSEDDLGVYIAVMWTTEFDTSPEAVRDDVAGIIAQAARRTMDKIMHKKGTEAGFATLSMVNVVMHRLGPTTSGRAYLDSYKTFRQDLDKLDTFRDAGTGAVYSDFCKRSLRSADDSYGTLRTEWEATKKQ